MKASNKFRMTHTFAILSGDAQRIGRIAKHYAAKLVSIAHEHKPDSSYQEARTYVVRIIENRNLIDIEVYVDSLDNVIEVERVIVIEARMEVDRA